MRHITHEVDLCVVGGGLAGMATAIAAARHGARVALDAGPSRPGGNVSSEVRMWICGAHGPNNRETGIIEELELEKPLPELPAQLPRSGIPSSTRKFASSQTSRCCSTAPATTRR